jgi:hypothetical protein
VSESAIEPRRVFLALVGVQALDALLNVLPNECVIADLVHLRLPARSRLIFLLIKAVSAVRLLLGLKWPVLGQLTGVPCTSLLRSELMPGSRIDP